MLAASIAGTTARAEIIHRYDFNAGPNDSVGGANAVLHNNAQVTGGSLVLDGLSLGTTNRAVSSDASGPYATLPGTVLVGLTNTTIEFWTTPTNNGNTAGTWSRIFDFGASVNGSGQNYIMFSPHDSSAGSRSSIRDAANHEYSAISTTALDDGAAHHVVIVYDAVGGWVEYYLDGALASSGRAAAPLPLSVLQTNNMYIGRSQWNGDAYLAGSIDEFRIWDRPLSGAEAMANQVTGPDHPAMDLSVLGTLTTINMLDPGQLTELQTVNTAVTGDFVNYPMLNILHLPGLTLTSSDPTVATIDASGNIKGLKPGTATMTAQYGSVTAQLVVGVLTDVIAPVLSLSDPNYDRVLILTSSKPLDPVSATSVATYQIDGGAIAVNSAILSTNGLVVTLRTAPFNLATAHTLAVTGLKDTVYTPNVVNGTYPFGLVPGTVTRKVWRNFTGTTLASFQALPTYPSNPTEYQYLSTASTPAADGDNYADMLEGYLIPDTTGWYSFAIASDDDSALYISTDSTVANLITNSIANVAGYVSAALRWTQYASQQSTNKPQYLVAGSKYYFRAIHREGTGGDFLQMAWQLTNGLAIADSTPVIPGANLAPFYDTPVVLSISSNPPASQTILQSRPVSFGIAVVGVPSYTSLQWYRNGQPIPNATNRTYSIANVALTNDGDVYYAVVANLAYTVQSSNAVLHVTPDTVAPTLVSANTRLGGTVYITFSEAMDPTSATTIGNYTIAGYTITNATLDASGTVVSLAVTPKITANFGVIVNNVKDFSGNPIASSSAINGFVLGVTPGMVAYWPLDVLAGGKTPDLVSGYDMTAVSLGATNVVAGKWGNAFYFDGVATLLKHTFATTDPMPIYKQPAHTISIWVNAGPNTSSQNDRRFFSESSLSNNQPLFNLGNNNSATVITNALVIYVRNDNGTIVAEHTKTSQPVFDNTWHHVCVVQTASNSPVKFYIDGVLDTLTYTPTYPMTQSTTTIGGIQRASASGLFPGKVDDVAVWNRALDPDEVVYLATHVTPTPPVIPLPLTINSFNVNLPAVQQGGSVILSWDVSKDADAIDIQPGIGSVLDKTVLGAGTLTIQLSTSMNYTLTVRRGVESKTAQLSVAAIGGVASGWTLLDNFDRYPVGSLGSPWLTPNAGLHIVDVNGNRMLAVNAAGAMAALPLNNYKILEGATATLFARLFVPQTLDIGQVDEFLGLTDKGLRSWGDYPNDCGPSIEMQNLLGDPQIGTENGYGSALEFAATPVLQVGNVYNFWMEIFNDVILNNDLVTMYIAKDGDATRTVLFQNYRSNRNPDDQTILGPTGPNLNNLLVGGNTATSLIYFDDLYLSVSNYTATVPRAFGFSTPIPAPAGQPKMTATQIAGGLVLSWSAELGAGYTLTSATDLVGATWNTVPNPVVPAGTNSTVTISPLVNKAFYRLVK